MKKILVMVAMMAAVSANAQRSGVTVMGEQQNEQFTLATLNVSGLPQKILVVKVNPDGPGDTGTARIGKYLAKKGYDLVMMQEDFNYHGVLSVFLEDDYKMDEWSGDVGLDGHKIDFLHLQNHRFDCDGLMTCWKNDLQVTAAGRTPWTQNFGKFSHANDEMVTKGFRRYDVTLREGEHIVVYNLHMDATMSEDEAEDNCQKDHDARMAQWAQLKEDVLKNLDSRPIIIAGDMNSLYGRDEVKSEFIDAIQESGRGTVSDVWVELQRNGVYPSEKTTEATAGDEALDKILYINPAIGTNIQPVALTIDRDGFLYEGKAMSDHWPVAATFQVLKNAGETTGMEESKKVADGESEKFFNLGGQRVSQPQSGIYIEQQGEKAEKRIMK
jgi:endonuclease/exonuclease/phosphatase family metal-dependent hydrolase